MQERKNTDERGSRGVAWYVKAPLRGWHAVRAFLKQDVWDLEISALPRFRRAAIRGIRILQLVVRGFRDDECALHASALTYYTLMAIVPVLALSLALARVFGGEALAREQVQHAIGRFTMRIETGRVVEPAASPGDEPYADERPLTTDMEVEDYMAESPASEARLNDASPADEAAAFARELESMVDQAFNQVGRIDFTTLGGIGLVLLFWMVIGVLGKVEASFNRVWGVSVERSLKRKFADYLSVLLILPFLVTAASSIPVVSMVAQRAGEAEQLVRGVLGSTFVRRLASLLLGGVAFGFVLVFMPNTRVRWRPGVAGGLVTSLLFGGWLRLCAALQIGVVRYSRLYGGFATVPILLAWVFVSWQIVLFGAELAFALQHADTYRMEQGGRHAAARTRLLLALLLVSECARSMRVGGGCFDAAGFAASRKISVRLLNEVLDELKRAGLIAEVGAESGHFLLCHDPSTLKIAAVVGAVLDVGAAPEAVGLSNLEAPIRDLDAAWQRSIAQTFDGSVGELATT